MKSEQADQSAAMARAAMEQAIADHRVEVGFRRDPAWGREWEEGGANWRAARDLKALGPTWLKLAKIRREL